ncbi:hypothetical protein SAMN05216199_3637 [Pedococcus cremeus]|uniref:Uncharacterized protein n=2 Tax=Pedococcus cremeus TaxID=587636 RepID=A0A1H9XD79_9MICO|nr:hypothetical protein SAMN05216199_3637 [Pedococcus cremeus]
MGLDGDASYVLMQVRTILEQGWYAPTSRIGAPDGLNPSWHSTADVLNFATIRLLGLFGGSPATVSALFFIAQFPLAALSAYWLARHLRVGRPGAVVVGVLFAVLPGHQVWFAHLWLAAYWMVPLALWLVVEVARGNRLWPQLSDLRGPGATAARWSAMRLIAMGVAVGLADVYYVAFTLLLISGVLLLRLVTGTRPRNLLPGAGVAAAVGGLCAISLVAVTRGRAGDQVTGGLPAQRVIGESETYAGRLIDLVLPWYEHRSEPLRFLTNAYGVATTPSVERPALGVVALVGLGALLVTTFAALLTGRRVGPLPGLLSALAVICLGFYTRGGLGSLVALFVTPQIRTWSRFVVLVGLLGLLVVGLALTRVGAQRGRRLVWPLAAIVTLVGVFDQTSPAAAPHYEALRHRTADLTAYTVALHREVGDCPVFQLPVVSFPEEPPPGRMGDYDHLLPSTFAPKGLSWSYGAIRGTARADWQLALPVARTPQLLDDIAAAGFCAVEVDRDGYAGGDDPSADIRRVAGVPVASAVPEALDAYDLRRLRADHSRRDAVLQPVVVSAAGSLIDTSGTDPFQWTGPSTVITLANMGRGPRPLTLTFRLEGIGPTQRTVVVTAPGAQRRVTVSANRSELVSLALTVQPGSTRVEVSTDGRAESVPGTAGSVVAALRLSNLRVDANGVVNAASLQQFAAASPRSLQ